MSVDLAGSEIGIVIAHYPSEESEAKLQRLLASIERCAVLGHRVVVASKRQSAALNHKEGEGLLGGEVRVIFHIDDDVVFGEDCRGFDKKMVEALDEAGKKIGAVGVFMRGPNGEVQNRFHPSIGDCDVEIGVIPGTCFCYDRVKTPAKWDIGYEGSQCDDTDFMLQIMSMGYGCVALRGVVVTHDNLMRESRFYQHNRDYLIGKWLGTPQYAQLKKEGWNPTGPFVPFRSVFIAVPAYNRAVTSNFCMSLIAATGHLRDNGIRWVLAMLSDAELPRAMDMLCGKFLVGDCESILFIDSDIGFEKDAIWKILRHPYDIVSAVCVKKVIPTSYTFVPKYVDSEKGQVTMDGSLMEILTVGSGFLRIGRAAMEKIRDSGRVIQYKQDLTEWPNDNLGDQYFGFFNTVKDKDSGNRLPMPDSFFSVWRDLGGRVWVDTDIETTHVGIHVFKSDIKKELLRGAEKA